MKKIFFLGILLVLLLPAFLSAGEMKKVKYHFEFDQMLQLRFGLTYDFNEDWGVRGAFGLSPPGVNNFFL